MGELWGDDQGYRPEPPDWPNKIVLPICGAIILFGAWYFDWLPWDAIKAILFHD